MTPDKTGSRVSSVVRKNAGSVAMVFVPSLVTFPDRRKRLSHLGPRLLWGRRFRLPILNPLQRAQLGAARSRVLRCLFFAWLERVFRKNGRTPFPRQRSELLFHFPVVGRHETDDHHP